MSKPTRRVQLPDPPELRGPSPLPGWLVAVPVVVSLVALAIAGVAAALLVVAVVPLGWGARHGVDRVWGAARLRRDSDRFEAEVAAAERALGECQSAERRDLDAAYPPSSDPRAVGRAAVTGVLVIGRGRVASSVVLDEAVGASSPSTAVDLQAGTTHRRDDSRSGDSRLVGLRLVDRRLVDLRRAALTLDRGPLCVPAATPVLVVGPPLVALSVAEGLRRQLVADEAGIRHEPGVARDEVVGPSACSITVATEVPPHPPDRGLVITLRADGSAAVTRADGVACDVAVSVSYVSLRPSAAPSERVG